MNDKLDYPWEKFSTALYSLAKSAPIKDRLQSAWMSYMTISEDDLGNDGLKEQFRKIDSALKSVQNGNPENGVVANSIAAMGDQEADDCGRMIAELAISIANARIYALEDKLRASRGER